MRAPTTKVVPPEVLPPSTRIVKRKALSADALYPSNPNNREGPQQPVLVVPMLPYMRPPIWEPSNPYPMEGIHWFPELSGLAVVPQPPP